MIRLPDGDYEIDWEKVFAPPDNYQRVEDLTSGKVYEFPIARKQQMIDKFMPEWEGHSLRFKSFRKECA